MVNGRKQNYTMCMRMRSLHCVMVSSTKDGDHHARPLRVHMRVIWTGIGYITEESGHWHIYGRKRTLAYKRKKADIGKISEEREHWKETLNKRNWQNIGKKRNGQNNRRKWYGQNNGRKWKWLTGGSRITPCACACAVCMCYGFVYQRWRPPCTTLACAHACDLNWNWLDNGRKRSLAYIWKKADIGI